MKITTFGRTPPLLVEHVAAQARLLRKCGIQGGAQAWRCHDHGGDVEKTCQLLGKMQVRHAAFDVIGLDSF